MGFFDKLKDGLSRTAQQLVGKFDDLVRRADTPERASAAWTSKRPRRSKRSCIMADVGVSATKDIVAAVRSARAAARACANWSSRRS